MAENSQNSNPTPMDEFLAQSDALNPARIEQPGPIAFNFNEPKPITNPIYPIKDYGTGASPNYYPSQVKDNAPNNPQQSIDTLFNETMNKINGAQDRNNYGYAFGYDSGPKGTLRDRYKGYGQETFNKVGFSPLINNEAWFNANTTFGDDLSRWWNYAAWPMLSKGFMDPIKSYASVINGEGLFSADEQSARDYEYYNAIGQSSKGGLGGFVVNLFNSASYSAGILTEGVIESVLIEGLTGAAGPGGLPAALGFGLGKFMNRLSQVPKGLYNTAKGTVKLAETMKDYSQISKAKDLFKTASANFGNFLNPLSNTSRALFGHSINNIHDLARASKTAGALWHDIMVMNLALSEGKLEGGFTKYQTYDRLYNEYMNDPKNKGLAPSLEEQENMMKEATKASFWNTLNNTALIFYSNKLVFPSLTNASFLKGAPKFGFGTVIGDINKEYQLVFNPGKNIAKSTFSKEKISLVNAIKSLGRPATYGKVGLNYFKANIVEGLQETLQDVLQEATQNYYVNTYKNNASKNFFYGAGLVGDAIKKQFSAQGAETFLSGFLMGSILQAPSKIKSYMTMGYNDYFKKDAKFRTYMEERESAANEVVEHMNTMWENSHYLFDPRMNNYATQALLYDVVSNPDETTTKEIHDTKFAAFQSAVISSLQRGTFDMFLKHYENYKQATPEDIEEAWHLKPGQGAKALENFGESLENAKKIAYRWGQAKDNFIKYQADLNNYEKDSYQYKMAQIYNQAFSQSLFNYVFLQGAFDDTSARIGKLYNKLAQLSTIKNSNFADFAGFNDRSRLQREIEMMKTDIETLEQSGVPIAAEELDRKRKLLELYSDFAEKQDIVINTYLSKKKLTALTEKLIEANPGLTREQLNLKVIDNLVKQYEEGKTTEFDDYKESFKKLLFGLGKNEEEKLKLQQEINALPKGLDGLFDDLLDTHILTNEKNALAPMINILSNPNDFYDHLLRNFQWMKNLYHNKKNIIKDIVNSEISNIERNALLNELADQKIFVDLDEFAKWIEDPTYRPEGFIDVTNNAYIPEGSLLYDQYYKLFENAAQLESTKPAGEPIPDAEVLQNIIDDLTKDRDKRLDQAKEKFEKALKEKYDATELELRKLAEEALNSVTEDAELEKARLEKYLQLQKELEDITKIRSVAVRLMEDETITNEQLIEATNTIMADPANVKKLTTLANKILKEDDNVETNDEAAENAGFYFALKPFIDDLVQEQKDIVDNIKTPNYIDVEKTPEWEQYQKELTDINDEYEAQVKEAKLDFVESGGNPTEVKEYTIEDDFASYPEDLQEELNGVFDDFLATRTTESATLKEDDPGRYNTLRERWMENDPVAQDILDTYNEKSKQEAIKNATEGLKPPKLLFGDAVIEPGTPLTNITDLYDTYEKAIKTKELETEKGVVKLSTDDIKAIKEDMKAIAAYIDSKEKAFRLKPIAQEVIDRIEQTIFNRQNELVLTVDEEGFESRRFRDSKPEDPRPERATEVAALMEQDIEEKGPFLFNRLEDNSIQNVFREVVLDNPIGSLEERIDSFLVNLRSYPQFQSDLKIAGIKESLMLDQSIENLENVVKKYSFKESSDAGINLDALIRQFLTLNPKGGFMEVGYDSTINIRGVNVKVSDLMSKQAYDFMFHPVTGSTTRLRRNMIDGGYQLFTGNVKVFDRNARDGRGVTGELDLLLIDTDGNLAVVDIKAAGASTWDNLGVPFRVNKKGEQLKDEDGNPIKNKGNKKTYFRAQQSIYRNNIFNMSGLDTDILLYPIEMTVTKDGYITKLSRPTADLSKNNRLSENGMFIILEPIDDATMQKFGFNRTGPTDTVEMPEKEGEEIEIKPGSVPVSDPEKSTLNDFLDQDVLYQGKLGRLVRNSDGGFSVEVEEDGKIAQYDINVSGKNAKDGTMNILKAGLSPIAAVESTGQVTQIAGQTINAKFLDKNERTAEINGVKYTVNRDETGAIVSLTYYINDKEISEVQEKINEVKTEINNLQKQKKERQEKELPSKNIERELIKKTFELNKLLSKKTELINKNKKRTRKGGNTDDLIFALNRLPNRFQKQVPSGEPTDREDQVNLIAQLSESESVTKEIDKILYEHGMPKTVERVIEGNIDNLTPAIQKEVEDWGIELLIKLEEYQSRLANELRSTVPVDNTIEALNEILNNLAAIKFFKNGKITKASRKEFERRTKVQQRTNVSPIQKSPGTTTEGVPGQTISREDLEKRIQESRQRIQGIEIGETPIEDQDIQEIRSKIEALFKDATLDTIDEIEADAIIVYAFGSDENLQIDIGELIQEIKNAKLETLRVDMSLEELAEGTILLNKEPILTFKKANETFIVKSVDTAAQTVELYSAKRKKSYIFTAEEIKTNFMKPVDEATPVDEINVTPQIKENIKSTTDNVQDLVKDTDRLDKIEDASKNQTKDDRLKNIRDKFNQC